MGRLADRVEHLLHESSRRLLASRRAIDRSASALQASYTALGRDNPRSHLPDKNRLISTAGPWGGDAAAADTGLGVRSPSVGSPTVLEADSGS